MNVKQYRDMLSDLELKRAELLQVHDQYAFGYARTVLANALNDVQKELDTLLNIELMPVPVVISIGTNLSNIGLTVGNTEQIEVTATLSDGSTRDVTKGFRTIASFRDYDVNYDNVGYITSVDASEYRTSSKVSFRLVKTALGWNVDAEGMLGLEVAETQPNVYSIVDIDGNPVGVKFTTNGNEEKGDNWVIEVEGRSTGTTYESSDLGVVEVTPDGLVYAVSAGTAEITVTNNNNTVVIPVTVA